jgi:hypothetical protein
LNSAWDRTSYFNVFFSYLHVTYGPFIAERNYPVSSISEYNF